jgi:hypothetical protein
MKALRCSHKNCNRFALAYKGILCKVHYFERGDSNGKEKETHSQSS